MHEAQRIADRTGDVDTLGLNFGPTNIRVWQISMEVEGGDPGRALEVAQATNPAALTLSRQVGFYSDVSRALASTGRDLDAVRYLARAERTGPQRVRSSRVLQEATRGLVERVPQSDASELRGIAERMGLDI
jgi:hypothetical protein